VTTDEIRRLVIEEIVRIAPDGDPAAVDPRADIREVLDLDSMDVLNLVIALTKRLAIDIPELDYPRLLTLDGAVAYLASKLSPATS
jgi:acyl carrier protein